MSRYFSEEEVADVLSVATARLKEWETRGLVSPTVDESGRNYHSFLDLITLKAIDLLEHQGVDDAQISPLLDAMRPRLLDLEDRLTHRVLTIFEDRIILTQKNHFVDSRAGRVLMRLDLDEIIQAATNRINRESPDRTADQWFDEGIRQLAPSGNSHLALAAFEEALKLDPNRVEAHINIGKIHHREHRLVDAERSFRLALARDPYHAEAQCHLGLAMEDLHCLEEAITCYERALAVNPGLKHAYYRMGRACAKAQFWDRALRYWNQYLLLDPDSVRADSVRRYVQELELALTE
ncbi:MAG: tetratricopeptide repeat protein [Acidobacteria bacterium]|nr:MAG: tetratricopeptide repeat protein [Acidobacteriota bacterium]